MATGLANKADRFFGAIDKLSYKVVYLTLAALVALPFIVGHWEVKPKPRRITRGFYDAIEECAAEDKIVLVLNAWILSSRGETQPQFECLIDHLMRRRVKFIMLSMEPDTTIVGQEICHRIERYYKDKYGEDYIQYGRDWLMLGYRAIYASGYWFIWVPNMKANGIVKSFLKDYDNKDLTTFPIMRRPGAPPLEKPGEPVDLSTLSEREYRDQWLRLGDFGLIVEIHFTQTIRDLIGLVRLDPDYRDENGKPRIKTASGTVNMVMNELLAYYDSHDLAGILAGLQGACEYSELLEEDAPGPSREGVRLRANSYSMGVLFVLFLVLLGNVSTLWKTLRTRG